jgi:hypothetical protein
LERSIFQKTAAGQTPQMAPHVVRADTEEKRRFDLRFVEHVQQPRHAITGAAIGVDINPQSCLHHLACAFSAMASRRKKSRVLPMVSSQLDGRLPVNQASGVVDAWFAVTDVLITLAVERLAFHFAETGERRKVGTQRMSFELTQQFFAQLANAGLVVRVADVDDLAVADAVIGFR